MKNGGAEGDRTLDLRIANATTRRSRETNAGNHMAFWVPSKLRRLPTLLFLTARLLALRGTLLLKQLVLNCRLLLSDTGLAHALDAFMDFRGISGLLRCRRIAGVHSCPGLKAVGACVD
jgi:hypothetical protein